ncbi:MAG TPA: RnfABCDGE type electron transport complex subunit D [Thermodesulfovibrionales bacterium]|nr:RnfABCDGE type electron transport complex subunit D [Thermodesulfovibrionales bacterium]
MAQIRQQKPLIISVSPHIKSEESTARIMWTVSASLLPAMIMGAYYFGPRAVFTVLLCIIFSLFFEYVFQKSLQKQVMINDGSGFLTGLLLGMNLPPSVPFYVPIIGSFIAIIITKQLFGGLGFNIFNPALIGRAFVLVSFPKLMTVWSAPTSAFTGVDALTTATPLGILKEHGQAKLIEIFGDKVHLYWQLLMGNRGGCIGETSAIALLLGAAFLFYRGYITWHVPISFLGAAALLAWIFGGTDGAFTGDPLLHVLGGGMILGAFFMATDYVTSPATKNGQIIFGIGCGFLTMLIRLKGGYPEGVMFAILIMNCFAPLIDRAFRVRIFGAQKKPKEAK